MNKSGSTPENSADDPFEAAVKQIAEILSATGMTSCEMTLTMDDADGAPRTSTKTIERGDLVEDETPGSALDGVFVLFSIPETDL